MKTRASSRETTQAYERLSAHEKFLRARSREENADVPSLLLAAIFDDTETIQGLLSSGENPDASGKDGLTALMYSARFGHLSLVRLLLDAGADMRRRDTERGATPLILAAENGVAEIFGELLRAGAESGVKTLGGGTLLHAAVTGRNFQIIKTSLARKIDVDARTTDGFTALHYAAWDRSLKTLTLLIKFGADVNAKAVGGLTPLIAVTTDDESFREANLDCTRLLVSHGADVNATDDDCRTPLMGAAFYGGLETVRYLVAHGASLVFNDVRGRTAESVAIDAGRSDIAEFLSEWNRSRKRRS